jgi:predicted nucleic acid-binding protein
MSTTSQQEAVLDTSVLVNFLRIGRLELLTEHPRYRFIVTDHVRGEITDEYPEQLALVEGAINSGALPEIHVTDPAEVGAFVQLQAVRCLGDGERSAIAVAANRGLPIALDDKRARREAHRFKHSIALVNTEAIIVALIQEGVLDVAAADAIKQDWEQNHRFTLPFHSFRERV